VLNGSYLSSLFRGVLKCYSKDLVKVVSLPVLKVELRKEEHSFADNQRTQENVP
jgi:hypothetical protein